MTEPVLKMVGLAVDEKPNKAAEIFSFEMADRAADYVQQAKDVISNGMMGQELPDSDDIDMDPEIDSEDDSYEDADEVETSEDEDDTYEADQEVVAEPEDDNPSEETEEDNED
jgi:hypothetical protein